MFMSIDIYVQSSVSTCHGLGKAFDVASTYRYKSRTDYGQRRSFNIIKVTTMVITIMVMMTSIRGITITSVCRCLCLHTVDKKQVAGLSYFGNTMSNSIFECWLEASHLHIPDNKVHGVYMGPSWVLSAPRWDPCWPHEPCPQGC